MTMLTLLSASEVQQLHAYAAEMLGIVENVNLLLAQSQTIDTGVDRSSHTTPVRTKTVQVSDTPKSQGKTRASRRKGRRGVSVLNVKKVAEIKRQLLVGGKTVAALAKEYRVHPTTINCIKWNKTWKEVKPAEIAAKPLEIVEIIK